MQELNQDPEGLKTVATGLSWCVYEPRDGLGDPLRIYNTTAQDVDLVIEVQKKVYTLRPLDWTYEPHYQLQAGDRIFRHLTPKELQTIAHLAAKTMWAKDRRKGLKGHRRDMVNKLRRKLCVFKLDEKV